MKFRIVLAFALVLVATCVTAERDKNYGDLFPFLLPKFKLIITPSFGGETIYTTVYLSDPIELRKVEYVKLKNSVQEQISHVSVILTQNEFELLKKQLIKALSFEYGDSVAMEDGEYWCVESNLYQPIKVCVQSPEYMTDERGYGELIKLKKYLDELYRK